MTFIVGLGNPGEQYQKTRHNVGFMVLDAMASSDLGSQRLDLRFKYEKKLEAEVCKSGNLVLVKPQTYMNLSGEAVSKTMRFYDKSLFKHPTFLRNSGPANIQHLFVVHDDLDIPLGSYKLQFGKGPKEHGGLSSIEASLKTDQFWRVRIGVEGSEREGKPKAEKIPGKAYVLQPFTQEQQAIIEEVIQQAAKALLAHIHQ